MPAQPAWFQSLTEIIADLGALQVPYIDRQAFERIFRVRDRRARVLMARFQGTRIGNAWAVDRRKLISALERIHRGEGFKWEQQRRRRVAEVYEEAKRDHPAKQVMITAPPKARTLDSLPSGVQLLRGELRLQFSGFEDFLSKLYELGRAVQNDFQRFQEYVEECKVLKAQQVDK